MDAWTSADLCLCLDRLRGGDESARRDLIAFASDRLRRLTRKMLRDDGRLARWEQTDDVLQGALMRLHRALGQVAPESPRQFYALATTQVRRELIDLARHHFGPLGPAARHQSDDVGEAGTEGSGDLADWGAFHEEVARLPQEEREVFELLWYQGLKQAEAAELLGVCARTVVRRWQSACLQLHDALGGRLPGV